MDRIEKLTEMLENLKKAYDEIDSVSFTNSRKSSPKLSEAGKKFQGVDVSSKPLDSKSVMRNIKEEKDGTGLKNTLKDMKEVKAKRDKMKKDEGPDKETKNFLDHWEPKTKHPKEATAGMAPGKAKGTKTTPTGFKLKLVKALEEAGFRESALLLKNWDEMDANAHRLSKGVFIGNPSDAPVAPPAAGMVKEDEDEEKDGR